MHWIIVNRARCGRCGQELVSLPAAEHQMCACGYLAVDGGREHRVRMCLDLPGDVGPCRNFFDTSILTATYVRRGGLVVEAFCTQRPHMTVGPDGGRGLAEPGDWIVFEPEGGHTAWDAASFRARHSSAGC